MIEIAQFTYTKFHFIIKKLTQKYSPADKLLHGYEINAIFLKHKSTIAVI